MQRLKAFYDCQICGKKHKLRAKWKFESEVKLTEFQGVNFEQQVRECFVALAKAALKHIHPEAKFEWSRLHSE